MLMIRFQRIGRRNDPAFRIVVTEKTASPKAGTYADLIGTYNPRTKAFTLAEDRVKYWIGKGAQVSPSLTNLLITKGVLSGKKINVLPKKRPIVKEQSAMVASLEKVEETSAEVTSVNDSEETTPEIVEASAVIKEETSTAV